MADTPFYWQHMLDAAAAGRRVFPLIQKHRIPVRWGTAASRSLEQVAAWQQEFPAATGYGIALEASDYVFDADNRDTVEWCQDHLPSTYCVRTGRPGGGVHFYFRVPHGRRLCMLNTRLAAVVGAPAGLDGKTKGGYVVGPGSVHASGKLYVELPGPARPAVLLERVMARIGDRPEVAGSARGAGLTPAEIAEYAANAAWGRALRDEAVGEACTTRVKLTRYLRACDDDWSLAFLQSANRLGIYVASGALGYAEAVGFFEDIFLREDAWGTPGSNVPRSIRRGLAHGARNEAASWL